MGKGFVLNRWWKPMTAILLLDEVTKPEGFFFSLTVLKVLLFIYWIIYCSFNANLLLFLRCLVWSLVFCLPTTPTPSSSKSKAPGSTQRHLLVGGSIFNNAPKKTHFDCFLSFLLLSLFLLHRWQSLNLPTDVQLPRLQQENQRSGGVNVEVGGVGEDDGP